jgi:hypothetical protein
MIGLAAAPASAYVITFTSDADFLANGNFTKYFNANVRWGDGTASGDWEYSLMDAAETTTFGAQQQHNWVENPGGGDDNPHGYLLDWDDGTGVASLSISLEANVSSTAPPGVGIVNALAIRARASGTNGEAVNLTSPITISFDDDPGNPLVVGPLAGDGNAEYIVIVDSRLGGGFDVAGAASIFKDDGSPPVEGSEPQYGFKVGFVPEPGTALLLGAGLGLLALQSRRRA